jgi:hypothetical protein
MAEFISSREPAHNKYGQNGYHGPSSQVPGDKPANGSLVAAPKAIVRAADAKDQTRNVSRRQTVPSARGHRHVNANPAKVPGPSRPVTR